MKTLNRILLGLAVSTLLPAAAMAQKVSYDYDRDQNFARLQTYAFKDIPTKETVTSETTTYDAPFVKERIQEAVASQLEARGMRRDNEHPDVYVVTRQTFETRQDYTVYSPYGWGWGYGWGYGWGPGYTDVQVRDIIVGTLTIDLRNAATGELIWRGVGVKTVHPTSKPERRDKRVVKVVAKIFKNYPGVVATSGDYVPRPE
jgi:hypothetical protein